MTAINAIAQQLHEDRARSLTEASDEVKTALMHLYLNRRDWDVDITFNMREFRDGEKMGQTEKQIIAAEIYAWAENEYGPQIEFALEQLRKEQAA